MNETLFLKKGLQKDLDKYEFPAFQKALEFGQERIIELVQRSGLKGRGGAGFPTGVKWKLAYEEIANEKYIICNGDEGEPGTFKDRFLMEESPLKVLEGIMIAAYAIGASKGYCYIRGEYAKPINIFEKLINNAREKGILGENIFGSDFDFDLHLVKGAGAYVCGDETSLINSIEGKRGCSRIKPPYPISRGLFDKPTVVNNVETLASVTQIFAQGIDEFMSLGTEKSRGTKLVCLSGDLNLPGVYEVEFGQATLGEIINEFGGGSKNNNSLKFVVPGGISTPILTPNQLGVSYTYEDIEKAGSTLGSGAVIVVAERHNLVDLMLNVAKFFMEETCGTCFPCREGNRQVYYMLQAFKEGFTDSDIDLIKDIGNTIHLAARCGLGQTSLNFISSIFNTFQDELKVGESLC